MACRNTLPQSLGMSISNKGVLLSSRLIRLVNCGEDFVADERIFYLGNVHITLGDNDVIGIAQGFEQVQFRALFPDVLTNKYYGVSNVSGLTRE